MELLAVVIAGLWALNWLGVLLMSGALGLRRRRWGTPGGGWALASGAVALVAPIVIGATVGVIAGFDLGPRDVPELLLPAILAVALGSLFASHACLVWAVRIAWRAADAGGSGGFGPNGGGRA